MVNEVTNFRHVGIVSSNISESLNFYCDLLDFKIEKKTIENPEFIKIILNLDCKVKLETFKLSKNNQIYLELLNFKNAFGSNSKRITDIGITHFALTIRDSLSLHKKIIKNGYTALSEPTMNEDGSVRVFFVIGPDNVYIELVEILK